MTTDKTTWTIIAAFSMPFLLAIVLFISQKVLDKAEQYYYNRKRKTNVTKAQNHKR